MRLPLIRRGLAGIDLLPERVQRQKRARKLAFRLAAAQIAIFLCLVMAVIGLNALEQQAWEHSRYLTQEINALRYSDEVALVAYAMGIQLHLAAEDAFFEGSDPAEFDPIWLWAILSANKGHMSGLDFDGVSILLTGIVERFDDIEAFRQVLIYTDIFEYVGLGRIRSQGDDRFFYELRLVPR